ncbi:MAG: hypothetical protein HUU37_08450, partial [Bdellovibrionales bacterium]|nr:hypothetical protein [Bdellovibrionales bacterium]
IQGHADLMVDLARASPEGLPGKLDQIRDKIARNMARIRQIVDGLKIFSHGNSAGEALQKIDLREVVEESLALTTSVCSQRDVRVKWAPPARGSAVALGIKVQVEQVLVNLIGNAAHAVAPLPERWVEVRVEHGGGEARIRVIDSGRLTDPAVISKLMTPFFTTKSPGEGTGLGLSMSYRMLERMGGSLKFCEGAEHTEFLVTLPTAE